MVDTFNKFVVALNREDVVLLSPPKAGEPISKDDAIVLACWLLVLAGDFDFEKAKEVMKECLH